METVTPNGGKRSTPAATPRHFAGNLLIQSGSPEPDPLKVLKIGDSPAGEASLPTGVKTVSYCTATPLFEIGA